MESIIPAAAADPGLEDEGVRPCCCCCCCWAEAGRDKDDGPLETAGLVAEAAERAMSMASAAAPPPLPSPAAAPRPREEAPVVAATLPAVRGRPEGGRDCARGVGGAAAEEEARAKSTESNTPPAAEPVTTPEGA
jgi:hypothetical protein